MSQTIRAFIAIELNDLLRQAIADIQKELQILDVKISWVKPQNAHITAKFLGDIPESKIDKVIQTLEDKCQGFEQESFQAQSLGMFPNERHPKVLWLGLDGPTQKLQGYVDDLETGLLKLHFHKDQKKFVPHITIGRVRSGKNVKDLVKGFQNIGLPEDLQLTVDHMTLFKSTLTPNGPIYESLARIPIQ